MSIRKSIKVGLWVLALGLLGAGVYSQTGTEDTWADDTARAIVRNIYGPHCFAAYNYDAKGQYIGTQH